MTTIVAVGEELVEAARALFGQYRGFLQATGSCGSHIPKLEREIAELPANYSQFGGDVLVAVVDGAVVGCVAYRAAGEDGTCEIKRLFVREQFRGLGVARQMVVAALERAKARGYERAILDTDAKTMAGALALYRSLGFRPYMPDKGNLSFLSLEIEGENRQRLGP